MSASLWLYCFCTIFYIYVAMGYNLNLSIKPHQNRNVLIYNENDNIDFLCEVDNVLDFAHGTFLCWYLQTELPVLLVKNDNSSVKKNQLILNEILTSKHDLSVIYCVAKIFDNENIKFITVGRSEIIVLKLNSTFLKMTDEEQKKANDLTAPVTERNTHKNTTENICNDNGNVLTALIAVSVIAVIIIVILSLILIVIYLSRKSKQIIPNGNMDNPLYGPMYSHTNSTYLQSTQQSEVESNYGNHYSEPILPPNKTYMNCQ